MSRIYSETFDDGPGGWFGWISNAAGPKPLEIRDGYALSRSPWWIDYNHAPPGAGYLHLLFMLNTRARASEHQREVEGENRFVAGRYPTNFSNARITLRLKGELEARGAQLVLLCQAVQGGICSGWLLAGQPFQITPDWSEQRVTATLELYHADPQLCIPLLVAENLDDIAADWRGWSNACGLPMLLVEADGIARPLEDSVGKVKADAPIERRKGRSAPKRRARFLARRREGDLGLRLVVMGEEIIARN